VESIHKIGTSLGLQTIAGVRRDRGHRAQAHPDRHHHRPGLLPVAARTWETLFERAATV
jgi:hypothetical protein